MSFQNHKKRKYIHYDNFIENKKIKIFNSSLTLRMNDLKSSCSIHKDDNICFIYGCTGITKERIKDIENETKNFDFYS